MSASSEEATTTPARSTEILVPTPVPLATAAAATVTATTRATATATATATAAEPEPEATQTLILPAAPPTPVQNSLGSWPLAIKLPSNTDDLATASSAIECKASVPRASLSARTRRDLKPLFSFADTGSDVVLHIYDVTDAAALHIANGCLQALGVGLFHVGVEVYGWEWSYGFTQAGSGVFASPPATCKARKYRQAHSLGRTRLSIEEVEALLHELRREWHGSRYNLVRNNCIHFSQALCKRLLVGPLPKWVCNLVSVGSSLQDVLDSVSRAGNFVGAASEVAAIHLGAKRSIQL
mmetsp:Transcript_49989/g.99280  ORF Transcript_49989/g.99280 Transcript_49989/m.99280 type:complete len:296 (+) Transcript_49989:32-919(+)|eukprot:CAMPEP_0172829280 /NCGR_PEP_ID=MMETSP1075-20121228/21428_1 /TAXON_ID=2916 /ORGANISM="Ceratium fusus, Strain PA161109" /LENGTH=295 /DNA_ID=CAMNT_0013671395 /DNA_START=26 /DNA_END=913 /DNA_ORIENTATION=-